MDTLRLVLKWFASHPWVSLICTLLLALLIVIVRMTFVLTDGVLTAPIKRGDVVDAVYGIGTVTANRSYTIKLGTMGTLTRVFVKEGDAVKKGAKLVAFDSALFSAPLDGVVVYFPFKIGENIFSQVPVLVLVDLSNRYLVVSLEQQGALRVKPGQKAKLSFDSIRQNNYEGVVASVYSYNGNFLARIDVSALPAEVLPDMTADIAITVAQHLNALLIPAAALEGNSVWVKRGDSLPKKVPIKVGIVDGVMVEVLSGDVSEGDQVQIRRKAGQ